MAVQQRRLGEGEALAARAGSGRGTAAADCTDKRMGGTAASQATAFLEAVMGARASAAAAAAGQAKDDSRSASQSSEQREDGHDGGDAAAPAMTAGSDSECEARDLARPQPRLLWSTKLRSRRCTATGNAVEIPHLRKA